jgi:hypothetical protein
MTTHVGTPNPHDSQLCKPTTPEQLAPCAEGRYVGAHTREGIADRRRKTRREERAQENAATKDALVAQAVAYDAWVVRPRLRLVGEAS